jgi:hypothetical protein
LDLKLHECEAKYQSIKRILALRLGTTNLNFTTRILG